MKLTRVSGLPVVLLLGVATARAQFSADFQTNTISGVVSNWAGNGSYVVGSNTAFNVLRIVGTGVLSNGSGFVGYETFASNATVLVTDNGSQWTNRFDLFVGIGSTGNQLIVSNQGAVFNGTTYIGYFATGHSNTAQIADAGSVWRVRTNLHVGYFTSGNQLIVSNGAVASDLAGAIGFTNAHNNVASVVGSGSMWSNAISLFVGYNGTGNQLMITDAGTVFSGDGYVGADRFGTNNVVTVAGDGSLWRNTNNVFVGYLGTSNALVVAAGGKVFSRSGFLGTNAVAHANSARVAGLGSVWSNAFNLFVGYAGADNRLTITNGGVVFNPAGTIGFTNTSQRNVVFIEGAGSAWSNAVFCYVGYAGSGNQLILSNGGTVFSGTGFLGASNIGSNNTATITGTGSTWANTNFLYVGYLGSSNLLVVADGGRAAAPETRVGFDPVATHNVLIVTGAGAVLSNAVNTIVGYGGTSNQMIVAAGGLVFDQIGNVGYTNQSARNTATVTGSGSVWSNTTTMYVGFKSASNRLVVADGGKVFDNEGYVGGALGGSNNLALVTGANSYWENVANLYVGYLATNNQLVVADGGLASATAGTIGFTNLGSRSSVWVTDTGSVWSNAQFTYVGYNGAFNQLIVSNGGAAWSGLGYIGALNLASNNTVTVTGPGSVWSVTNQVYVGYSGDRNSLVIAAGGVVRSLAGTVGYDTVTVSNSATITGAGSLWTNALNLTVGTLGAGNTLTITNGGAAVNNGGAIGSTTVGNSNLVIVTGIGSVWSNRVSLSVGVGGRGNRLIIADGGKVFGPTLLVGNSGSSNSAVLVTGTGSEWRADTNITDRITVGYSSRGNTLVISNGGLAFARSGTIGDASFGDGHFNTGMVTGVSSVWSNTGTFSIGIYGYRNHLTITNGGAVFDADGILGAGAFGSGSNNTTLVTGPGSLWDNTGSLTLGLGGNSNRLTVANLGKVRATNLLVGQSTTGNQLILSNGLVEAASITVGGINTLSGSGTIDGNVLNAGTINANISGATLTFNGVVKNQATLSATGGGIIEFYGPVLNLGVTNFTGGTAIFHGPVLSTAGTTNSWTFAGDDAWQTAARWSLGVAPSSSNAVLLITNATTKTVTVDATTFSSAPGSVTNSLITVAGPGTTTNTLRIVNTPAPFLALFLNVRTNAALLVSNATVEVGVLDTGSLTMDGSVRIVGGALLDARNAGTVTLGNGFGATTIIEDSSMLARLVNLGFGSAAVTTVVSGAGAMWSNDQAIVYNNNVLILSNGAQAASTGGATFYLGNNAGTVTDPGTTWRAGIFQVGYVSGFNNHFVITNGAEVECNQVSMGIFGSGSNRVTVAGNGARWDIRTSLQINIGDGPNDGVNIGPGGTVTSPYIILGDYVGGTNFVNVTGGSLYVTNSIGNAPFIVGSLLLLNTGTVTVDNFAAVTNNGNPMISFRAGALHSKQTSVTNLQQFVVGDATNAANFRLLGGVHSFNDGLVVRTNALLSGCGTINATVVVDAGGTVIADCSPLVFTGSVTNNGTMRADNGDVLEFYGAVVNNGVIDLINGGVTNFHGAFINNGVVLDAGTVVPGQATVAGSDILIQVPSVAGHTYQLQSRDSFDAGNWLDVLAPQAGNNGVLTFIDFGGATNGPSRFYRFRVTP